MVTVTPWHFILAVLAGWVHREQLKVIEYLQAECAWQSGGRPMT